MLIAVVDPSDTARKISSATSSGMIAFGELLASASGTGTAIFSNASSESDTQQHVVNESFLSKISTRITSKETTASPCTDSFNNRLTGHSEHGGFLQVAPFLSKTAAVGDIVARHGEEHWRQLSFSSVKKTPPRHMGHCPNDSVGHHGVSTLSEWSRNPDFCSARQ